MHQRKQLPLGIDFASASEREAAQPMVVQVPEHGFDNAEPSAVSKSSLAAVDSGFHGLGVWMSFVGLAAIKDGDLPKAVLALGLAQALRAERTATTHFAGLALLVFGLVPVGIRKARIA